MMLLTTCHSSSVLEATWERLTPELSPYFFQLDVCLSHIPLCLLDPISYEHTLQHVLVHSRIVIWIPWLLYHQLLQHLLIDLELIPIFRPTAAHINYEWLIPNARHHPKETFGYRSELSIDEKGTQVRPSPADAPDRRLVGRGADLKAEEAETREGLKLLKDGVRNPLMTSQSTLNSNDSFWEVFKTW